MSNDSKIYIIPCCRRNSVILQIAPLRPKKLKHQIIVLVIYKNHPYRPLKNAKAFRIIPRRDGIKVRLNCIMDNIGSSNIHDLKLAIFREFNIFRYIIITSIAYDLHCIRQSK